MPADTLVAQLERGLSLEESLTGEPPKKAGLRLPTITPSARMLTVNGVTRPLVEWARDAGLSIDALAKRIDNGWAPAKAVTTPRQATNRPREVRYGIRAGQPGSWSWYELPYERDAHAQAFVSAHPDGATMGEVGAAMGIELTWVCEIEQGALKKLRKLVDDGELTEAELVAALDTIAEHAPDDFDPDATPARPERTEAKRCAHRAAARRGSALTGRPLAVEDEDVTIERMPSSAAADEGEEPRHEHWEDVPDVADDDANEQHHAAQDAFDVLPDGAGDERGESDTLAADGEARVHPWHRTGKSHLAPRRIAQIRHWAANSSRVPAEALEWD
jgi:hypothetical protein